jgi:hypothetical protein
MASRRAAGTASSDDDVDEIPGAGDQEDSNPPQRRSATTFSSAVEDDKALRRGAMEGTDQDLADLARRQYSKRRRRASIDFAATEDQLKLREAIKSKDPSSQFELVDPLAELTGAEAAAAAAAAFEAEQRSASPRWRTLSLLSKVRTKLVSDDAQNVEELLRSDPLARPPPSCVGGVIHPLSRLRRTWDMFMFSLLTYCAITVPYRVGFEVIATGSMLAIETLVDVFFIVDIFVRFRMGYTIDSEHLDSRIEMRPPKIACAYLKSWFLIDVLSGFPTQLVTLIFLEEQASSGTSATRLPRLLRLPRLVRMMRLMKLLRVMRFFRSETSGVLKWLGASLGMPPGTMRAVRLMTVIVVVAHTVACSWFFCHSIGALDDSGCDPNEGCEPAFSWWDNYCGRQAFAIDMGLNRQQLMWTGQELAAAGYSQPPMCEDKGLQYVVSLYWAVTTLTTMGYGDIGSQQPWEYAFSVVVMLMGVSCYAYIASNISIVLSSLDQEKTEMRDHLEKLEHFMFHKRLTRNLRRRLRAYFNEYSFCSTCWN